MKERPEAIERKLPVAVEHAQQLWVWLDARVVAMPAHARPGVGARVLGASLDILELLVQAAYESRASQERPRMLRDANRKIAFVRVMLRGVRERKYITPSQHAYVVEQLDTLGRMVGGWLSKERENP